MRPFEMSDRKSQDCINDCDPPVLNGEIGKTRQMEALERAGRIGASVTDQLPVLDLAESSGESFDFAGMTRKTSDAMREYFYGNHHNDSLPRRFFASLPRGRDNLAAAWDIGQVLEATLYAANVSKNLYREIEENEKVLERYWDPKGKPPAYDSSYGPSGDKYYDDNTWIGIALLDTNRVKPDRSYLERAKQIHEFNEFGTRGTEKLTHAGGVFWTQQEGNLYRATVSTAGAAQLALELYQETHDQKYLQFAVKQYDWVNENLRAPNGLYYDGMDKDGTLHKEHYTYNQGLMLGNASYLYQATGEQKYLNQAQEIAKASLENFSDSGKLESFKDGLLFFNAVFFKNLMLLDSVSPDPAYRKALADYAGWLSKKVDPITNLVNTDGKPTLLDQSAAVQVFSLADKLGTQI